MKPGSTPLVLSLSRSTGFVSERFTRMPEPSTPFLILSSTDVSLSSKTFLRLRSPVGSRAPASCSTFLRPPSAMSSPASPVRLSWIASLRRFTAMCEMSAGVLHAFGSTPLNGSLAMAVRISWRSSGESMRNLGFVSSWRFS